MGIIKNGINGGFRNKAGTVVGYNLMGQDIIRSSPEARTSKPTPAEHLNRTKFKTSQSWLQPITPVLRIGFENYKPFCHGFNGAKSFTALNAVIDTDNGFEVDPSLACVSHGPLSGDPTVTVELGPQNDILFTWDGKGKGLYDDRVIAVAYDITAQKAEFDTSLAQRAAKKASLWIGKEFAGHDLHIYFAFVSEDRKQRSISQYLGIIQMPLERTEE